MSTYKASIYNYLFNSINAIVVIVNGIVMVPIYFHYMSVSTYGAWLATGNVIAMLGLLESGFASVITQKMSVAIAENDSNRFRQLAGSNITTALALSGIIGLLGLCISPFITRWINVEDSIETSIFWAYIIALMSSCIAVMVSLFGAFPQVWQNTKTIGIINTVSNLIAIGSLVMYLLIGLGVISIALSYLTRALINLTFQGRWIIRKWKALGLSKPLYSKSEFVDLSKACIYPFMSKLSSVLMGNSQSFILAHFLNPTFAAIYDLTSKVCYVACGFVSMTNGSFFALFSLTLASKDKKKINSVFKAATQFFIISLAIVALYSICFTEAVCNYWVGLDKFGGKWLLIAIVIAKILFQIKAYCNNILYTGGLINKSAKLDILCMVIYIGILIAIIMPAQVFAVPIAMFVSSALFIVWYLRLLKKEIELNVISFIAEFARAFTLVLIFVVLNYYIAPNYHSLIGYGIYFFVFSITYFTLFFATNKLFFNKLVSKIRKK